MKTLVAALLLLCCSAAKAQIVINGNGSGRTFDGVGAISAGGSSRLLIDYPEPQRTEILDFLFKPNYGASLQTLKVEVGGEENSGVGSEPTHMRSATDQNYTRGYEWWLMQQAVQRNPNIILQALAWGTPGWVGTYYSIAQINYLIHFIQGAAAQGLTISTIGIWNETAWNDTWIKQLKAALVAAHLSTRIVAADSDENSTGDLWGIVTDMKADPALLSAIDFVGVHYAERGPADSPAIALGKPLWASEDGPWRNDWSGAQAIASQLNKNYITYKETSTQIWALVTSYYGLFSLNNAGLMTANQPWSGYYSVDPAIWAMAHTAQFVQPGWHYIDSACGFLPNGGSYVTLTNGNNYSVIVETGSASATQALSFQVTNGLSLVPVNEWKTNQTSQFVEQPAITLSGNTWTTTVAPNGIYSFTTTTGQTKGTATTPPPAAAQTLPFTNTSLFSDLVGAFESVPCVGRSGLCIQQQTIGAPISWHSAATISPLSVAGDYNWTDYTLSVDFLFTQPGEADLLARFTSETQSNGYLFGYEFFVNSSGTWSLMNVPGSPLGFASVPGMVLNTWHNMKLVLTGGHIEAYIDSVLVANVYDTEWTHGMVGIGTTGFTGVQFSNVSVTSGIQPPPPAIGLVVVVN